MEVIYSLAIWTNGFGLVYVLAFASLPLLICSLKKFLTSSHLALYFIANLTNSKFKLMERFILLNHQGREVMRKTSINSGYITFLVAIYN